MKNLLYCFLQFKKDFIHAIHRISAVNIQSRQNTYKNPQKDANPNTTIGGQL